MPSRTHRDRSMSLSGADGQQRLPSEQPSVTRRCSGASIEKSTLKYQTLESYAPPAPMSGANRGLTAWPDPLRKISELVAGDQFGDVSKLFSQSRSAFARFAVRPFRLLTGDQNDMLRSDHLLGQLDLVLWFVVE